MTVLLSFLFGFVVFSVFFEMYQIFEIAGFGVTPTVIASFVLYALVLLRLIFSRTKLEIQLSYSIKFFFLFAIAGILSGLYPLAYAHGPIIIQYLKSSAHFYSVIIFTFLCFSYKIKNTVWTKVLQAWLVVSVIANVYGIYQLVARALDLPLAWIQFNNSALTMRGAMQEEDAFQQISIQFQDFYRSSSFFTEPSGLAFFNIIVITLLIVPFIQKKQPFFNSKLFLIIAFVLSLINLLIAYSLTGLACLACVIITIFLIENKEYIWKLLGIIAIGLALIVISDSIVEDYTQVSPVGLFENRLSGIKKGGLNKSKQVSGESLTDRFNSGQDAIRIWQRSPIVGVGLGTYQYQPEARYPFIDQLSLQTLAETGIIGFIALIGMLSTTLFTSYRLKKLSHLCDSPEDRRLNGIAIYMAVIYSVNYLFIANSLIAFPIWTMLGMIFSIHRNASVLQSSQSTAGSQ